MALVAIVLALAFTLDPLSIVLWLVIGLVAGFLASRVMRGGGYGVVDDIVVGLIGALIGGFLAGLLGLGQFGLIGSIIVAFIGKASEPGKGSLANARAYSYCDTPFFIARRSVVWTRTNEPLFTTLLLLALVLITAVAVHHSEALALLEPRNQDDTMSDCGQSLQ